MGLVQGVTEFFPISSSGHLVLAQLLLGTGKGNLLMILVLHLGSLMAILTFYRQKIYLTVQAFLQKPGDKKGPGQTVYLVLAATIPLILGALFLSPWVRGAFHQPVYTAWGFFLTGTCLFLTLKPLKKQSSPSFEMLSPEALPLSFKQAVGMGFAQVLALFPGMSRTGWTISMGVFLGVPRNVAVFFSFLMAIPAILGAAAFEIIQATNELTGAFWPLSLGFFSSWFFSFWALKGVVHSVSKKFFPFFAFYLWPLGGILWLGQ